jgi:phosphoribosylformylglycinamidine synthase II
MTTEPIVTLQLAKEHGLLEIEYEKILSFLGRTPTFTELGIYSVMWSEHCSYKNSILVLKNLPRKGKNLLVEAGEENAGVVSIGGDLGVVFKIESHNHPSAVEPYQGAATGVGGIMRDIFTMGARPIASLNSLRFGSMDEPRVQYLLDGVVRGIGDYGNSFGVPTVAGEVYFDKCYAGNPLVNAMAVGIVEKKHIATATASGTGNPVLIVGSSTGRDGIHGATFASVEISEESEAKRPSVQVGDPFTEKLLLEATLEAIESGDVVGIQDMGAAGITCSTSEMSAKGSCGMEINLDLVPIREKGMSAYEIMLSESQERMLIVAKKGKEDALIKIFKKWDLNAVVIGHVTDGKNIIIRKDGKIVADIPAKTLVLGGDAPVYEREATQKKPNTKFPTLKKDADIDFTAAVLNLLSSPNIASKRWVYEQYDSMVRTNTVTPVGKTDAAVVRIKGTTKTLAMKTDCNSRYVYLNPRKGGQIAVAECARNIVCTGAKPLAITNCLNFGNPYKPDVYFQFKEAATGMAEACVAFETPVTGGNVSFYNENPDSAIYPTPTIGMIGLLDDVTKTVTSTFKAAGDTILLLGENTDDLNASEFLVQHYAELGTDAPHFDLQAEKKLHDVMLELADERLLKSAHDVSEGGLAVAIMESAMMDDGAATGAKISLTSNLNLQSLLFGESQSRIVISATSENVARIEAAAKRHGVPCTTIGTVAKDNVSVAVNGNTVFDVSIEAATEKYFNAVRS